ncbi:hypothetical protein BD309DRAFT_282641 [Dichomitus squalens]|nr:hypothetical protein BD309DRAFT_282641 [Dichomitus squalens]
MMQVSPSIALHRYQKPWSPPPFASLARPLIILVRLCPLTPALTTESHCMGHISRAACRICPCLNRAIPCAIAVPLAKRPNLAYKNIQVRSCSPAAQRRASFLPTQSAELPAHRAPRGARVHIRTRLRDPAPMFQLAARRSSRFRQTLALFSPRCRS